MQFFNFNSPDRIEKDATKQIKVQRAKMKAYSQLTEIELEKLQSEEQLQPRIDEIDKLKMNILGKKTLQKQAWTYKISANALSLVSALMTICGIAGINSLFDIADAFIGKTGVFAVTAALLQMVVINLNKRSFEIKQNHFLDYKGIAKFKAIVIGVSMVGNFQYMNSIMPNNLFYTMVSLAVAISLDFGSIWISNLATNVKYRNYTNDDIELGQKTRLDKLLFLISDFCLGWIDRTYDAKFANLNETESEAEYEETELEKTILTTDKQRSYDYSTIVEKIKSMPPDTVVTKDTFGLNTYEWKLCRQDLEKEDMVYCDKKKTYTKKQVHLADVAKELIEC